jgi:hypothetical protein
VSEAEAADRSAAKEHLRRAHRAVDTFQLRPDPGADVVRCADQGGGLFHQRPDG